MQKIELAQKPAFMMKGSRSRGNLLPSIGLSNGETIDQSTGALPNIIPPPKSVNLNLSPINGKRESMQSDFLSQ